MNVGLLVSDSGRWMWLSCVLPWLRGWAATGLTRAFDEEFQTMALERHSVNGDLWPEGDAPSYDGPYRDPQDNEVEPLFTGIGGDGDDRPTPINHDEEPEEAGREEDGAGTVDLDGIAEEEAEEAGSVTFSSQYGDAFAQAEEDERELEKQQLEEPVRGGGSSSRSSTRSKGKGRKPPPKSKLTAEEEAMVGKRWVEEDPDGGDVPLATYRIVCVAWDRKAQQKIVWFYDESDPRFVDGVPLPNDPKKRYPTIKRLCESQPVQEVKAWLAATEAMDVEDNSSDSEGDEEDYGGSGVEEDDEVLDEGEEEEEDDENDWGDGDGDYYYY